MNEKIRPCPFCGNIPKETWTVTELGTKYPAYKCECFSGRIIAHKWNNAFCWDVAATNEFEDDLEHGKEVAKLKAALQAKDAEIAELKEKCGRIAAYYIDPKDHDYIKAELQAERSQSEKLKAEIAHLNSLHSEVSGRNVTLACENVELKHEIKVERERLSENGTAR